MLDERPESVAAFVSEQRGEVALCPNCLSPTFPGLHCCYVCMAPVGDYVAWLPFERIWATAWIVWKATWTIGARPIHAIAATGGLLLVAFAAWAAVQGGEPAVSGHVPGASVLNLVVPILGAAYYGSIAVLCLRIIRNVSNSNKRTVNYEDESSEWDCGVEAE